MHIALCGSLDFTTEMTEIAETLRREGHEVTLPQTSQMILDGKVTLEQIMQEKASGDIVQRAIRQDPFTVYYEAIKKADAILVVNITKKGVENYIGGNTLIEMAFAHVLKKKIYCLYDIPDVSYEDELRITQPVILNGYPEEITTK